MVSILRLAQGFLALLCIGASRVGGHEGHQIPHGSSNSDEFNITQDSNGCTTVIYKFNPLIHKPTYKVGVYSSEGDEVVYAMYGKVFEEYLSATAGQQFDPPITFEVIPVTLTSLMELADDEEVDFFFSSSAVFSCMATEYEAQSLVTIINRRESRGHQYDLDVYGGVMFTLASNTDINRIADFKDRIIGAGSITAMGGGQTQFYEMVQQGLSYVADPKQVIFTHDERLVVQGLLDGDFEIGFARTDQIERHVDVNGEPLRDGIFKIIHPQSHILDDGTMFPFVSSTGLNPEWPVAALDHVHKGVSEQVQGALLDLQDHLLSLEMGHNLLCATTHDIAHLAYDSSQAGMFTGFRTARSYFEVRTKQEMAAFLRYNEADKRLHCIRGDTLYHDIDCPAQYYKVTEEEFEKSCELAGLPCKEGYECYCQPCVKAFEVSVFPYAKDENETIPTDMEETRFMNRIHGCDKMTLCGQVEQSKVITFHAIDNVKRENPVVQVQMHYLDHDTETLDVHPVPNHPYEYEFEWSNGPIGVAIMEIFFDGEQIPESPMRVQIVERQCDVDFPGRGRVASAEDGTCVCGGGTLPVGDRCVTATVFAIAGSTGGLFLFVIAGMLVVRYKNRKADEIWQVNVDELHFDDPIEIIGQGSFGTVLLAEYRGTKVAIKSALKTKGCSGSKKGGSRGSRSDSKNKIGSGGSADGVASRDSGLSDEVTHSSHEDPNQDYDVEATGPASGGGDTVPISRGSTIGSGAARRDSTTDDGRRPSIEEPGARFSHHFSLAFLYKEYAVRSKNKWWSKLLPCWSRRPTYRSRFHESILGSATGSISIGFSRSIGQYLCPCFNEKARRRAEFQQEMRTLSRLRHPCITTVMGAVVTNTYNPMLVMEYMEYGSLYDLLRNETMHLSGEIILQVARDLAQGLRYLHSSKPPILHGDLKAKNILIDSRFRAKICDFGLSTKKMGSISGTPYWLPPEYLRGEKRYDTTCDVYSVGVILYEIYSRKTPYEGENYVQVMKAVCNRRVNKRPQIPKTTPPKFAELMKKCWSHDAGYRPLARDLDMALCDMSVNDAEPMEEDQVETNKIYRRHPSGDMLYELFPKHVADALKKGQKVEPESHELVTVIFSDIIHFTDICHTISPEKVCDMLDRLYLAFDSIAKKHQVFKVETIGDAYMGVTNLENNQNENHVRHIAEFAIDMVNEANKILIDTDDPGRGTVNIRVGFHSGPVVSNVIGSMNKRYGLFGDTVNTASRMESNSGANRILCSERAYKLLRVQAPEIKTKKRGKIQVKGKGDMNAYWVVNTHQAAQQGSTTPKGQVAKQKVGFAEDQLSPFLKSTNAPAVMASPQPPVTVAQPPVPVFVSTATPQVAVVNGVGNVVRVRRKSLS